MTSFCSTCWKQGVTFFCSRCKTVYYCDINCQRKDWKKHKKICFEHKQDTKLKAPNDTDNQQLFETRINKMDWTNKCDFDVGNKFGYLCDDGILIEAEVIMLHSTEKKIFCSLGSNHKHLSNKHSSWIDLPNQRICSLEQMHEFTQNDDILFTPDSKNEEFGSNDITSSRTEVMIDDNQWSPSKELFQRRINNMDWTNKCDFEIGNKFGYLCDDGILIEAEAIMLHSTQNKIFCSLGSNHKHLSNNHSLWIGVPNQRICSLDKMCDLKAKEFQKNEEVVFKSPRISDTQWMGGIIINILPNHQYKVRMQGDIYVHSKLMKRKDYVINEYEMKKKQKRAKKMDLTLQQSSNLLDLYLNGRDCQNEMKSLSKAILSLNINYNQNEKSMDMVTSQFLSVKILEYIYNAKYKWRVSCFWCNDVNIRFNPNTARHTAIDCGGHTLLDYGQNDYSIFMFCDQCNSEVPYDDILYHCSNNAHDVCIKCLYKTIKSYGELNQCVVPILSQIVDGDSVKEIIQFVVGDITQFVYAN